MMIFTYRLLSDEVEDFVRDIEIPFDHTLLDLHNYINQELGYTNNEMASFFESDVEWEKLREYTLLDMGSEGVDIDEDDDIEAPMPMEHVKLGQATPDKFGRLIYVFDIFNERQLFIELIKASVPDESVDYPRTIDKQGDAPQQMSDSF